jgi:hypothetical protein
MEYLKNKTSLVILNRGMFASQQTFWQCLKDICDYHLVAEGQK